MAEKEPKTSIVDIHMKKGNRPEFDIYIGRYINRSQFNRAFEGSKWSNPYLPLDKYEIYIRKYIKNDPEKYNLNELKGKRLGCWCITTDKLKPLICHGQILMKLIKEREVKD